MTITITISTENLEGEEVYRLLDELAWKVRDWPGASSFRLGLIGLDGSKVGECVAK